LARQVVYEGSDLQQLLQQVIDEHGPARIHPPERRRKGGVLGFFAREVYVITVDVDAPAGTAAAPDRPGTETGAVPAAAHIPATALGGVPSPQARAHVAAPGPGGAGAPPEAPFQTPLAALVESTEDEADIGGINGSARSSGSTVAEGASGAGGGTTNGSSRRAPEAPGAPAEPGGRRAPMHAAGSDADKPFGEVLSEVASSLGEEPGTYRPDPERLRRPRRPAPSDTLFETPQPAAEPAAAEPAPVEPAPVEPAAGEPAAGEPAAAQRAPAEPAPKGAAPEGAVSPPPAQPRQEEAAAESAAERTPGPPPAPEPEDTTGLVAVQLPLIQMEDEGPPDLGATIVDLLRAAGFPDHLLPRAPFAPELSTIEAVFGALPEPPPLPTEPGGLVAVVGSAGLVRPVANAVALSVGCPRDEVAVASSNASDRHARPEYRARTAAQAASMSPGWRRDRVGVVAVYAPPLGADQRWTRQVLRALRPSCVWGMVGATTKPDDVRRWITAVGGVDALAMTEVSATATPAAILSLGVPVTRLDDEPATPERWAAVVADLVTKH
jgi:hypothetical protein